MAPSRAAYRRADPRLAAYLLAGFAGLLAAVVTGTHELAMLAAAVLAPAAIGLASSRPVEVRGAVRLDEVRVAEGGLVEGRIHVAWEGLAEVDVLLAGWRGVSAVKPAPVIGWAERAGQGPVELAFRMRARSWGVHHLGTPWVRVRRPGALVAWDHRLDAAPAIRVFPAPLRLDRMLRPAEPRAVAGMHLSRLRGYGTDFAELRPYQQGDRWRDVSWGTSARLGAPWVIVHHPERTGTVLLMLDAFVTEEGASTEALARAARAVWAVASIHLRAQDRVGLLAFGRSTAWMPPRGGRRARWLLLEELLSVGHGAEHTGRRRAARSRVSVPGDALVVGMTGLGSSRFLHDLVHLRRARRTTVALVIDTSDLLPPTADPVAAAARRLWLARRDADRHLLGRAGIPTALVTAEGGVGPAVASLYRAGARREGRRARRVR